MTLRRCFLTVLIAWGLPAAERHVGTGHPYSRIQAAVDAAQPGDVVVVHAGTYRESVRVATDDVLIRNAGLDRVIVSGLDPVGGWSAELGLVQQAPLALAEASLDDTQVFVDGVWLAPASYPDRPRSMLNWGNWGAKISASNTGTVRFFDGTASGSSGLPAGDWTGAILHFNAGNGWVSHQGIVASHDAGSVTCVERSFTWERYKKWDGFYNNGGGKGYLIQHRRALDRPGEWFWDRAGQRLFLWSPDGQPVSATRVEAQTRRWGITFAGCTGSVARGLHVQAAAVRAINGAADCRFEDGSVRYGVGFIRTIGLDEHKEDLPDGPPPAVRYSMEWAGDGHVVRRSLISHGWGGGIRIGADGLIEDCLIEDLNWASIYAPAIGEGGTRTSGPPRQTVRQCTIRHVGRDAIRPAAQSLYELNDLHDAMALSRDGGIIYGAHFDHQGTRITRNWIHDVQGSVTNLAVGSYGIYCDIDTDGWVLDRNVLWNLPTGIVLHAEPESGHVSSRYAIAHNTQFQVGQHYKADAVEEVFHWNNAIGHDRNRPFSATAEAGTAIVGAAAFRNSAFGDFRPATDATTLLDQGVVNPYSTGAVGSPDIGAYERNGGLATGRWRPGVRALMPEFADDLQIRLEAEAAQAEGFVRVASDLASGRALARLESAEGTLRFRAALPAGLYDVHLIHHDEEDGSGTLRLTVGDTDSGTWSSDWNPGGTVPENGNRLTGTWRGVRLDSAQAITVQVQRGGDEALCIDHLELIPRLLDSERFDTANLIHNQHGEDTAPNESWFARSRSSFWPTIHTSQTGSLIEFGVLDAAGGLGADPLMRITPLPSKPPVASEWWTLAMAQGKAADPAKTYAISFRARAEAPRKMTVLWRSKIFNATYLLRHVDLGTTAQTISITDIQPVTSDGLIDRTAELVFAFGQHPARVWMDDLDMREIGDNASRTRSVRLRLVGESALPELIDDPEWALRIDAAGHAVFDFLRAADAHRWRFVLETGDG